MTKFIAVGLSVTLSLGTAFAQPAPAQPAPAERPVTPTPPPAPENPAANEKAAGTLQPSAAGDRPWAAGVSQDQQNTAMKFFREANQNHNDGLFVKAAELYTEALKAWDHPAINYNLALSLMNLDRPMDVEVALTKAIKYGPAPLAKDKFDHAKEYLTLIQQQLATIEVSCSKPGAKVSVDGKEVFTVAETGEAGIFRQRVKIGKHTFVAEKPGYNAEIEAPFIGPGETFRIELKLYTAEELTRYKRRWSATWMPYVVVGGGVAMILAGGAMQMAANSSYTDFDEAVARCGGNATMPGCSNDSLVSMRDSGDTKKMVGYIAYGVGGAAIVTGAVLLLMNRRTSYQISADEYRREQRTLQPTTTLTPVVGPGFAGAMVRGGF